MILGVMSDTHGNLKLMSRVASTMGRECRVDVIFHLGDDYPDGEILESLFPEVRKVPGLWCAEYQDARIPKRLTETFDGLTVSCAHASKDIRAVERAAAIILTGHTHAAAIEHIGHHVYVNPGHLRKERDRGETASFATIAIGPSQVAVRIHEISGAVRVERRIARAQLA